MLSSQPALDRSDRTDPPEGGKFLRFAFPSGENALLGVDFAAEIIIVRISEVLPVPQMPPYILGAYNWRGEMLWLVDLGRLLGFSPLLDRRPIPDSAMTIVCEFGEKTVGFAVDRALDLETYDLEKLHPSDRELFSPQLIPFLRGFFLDDRNDTIIVLDAKSIFEALGNSKQSV